jgi:hypothetical protein
MLLFSYLSVGAWEKSQKYTPPQLQVPACLTSNRLAAEYKASVVLKCHKVIQGKLFQSVCVICDSVSSSVQ